jgi:hypothetical protein
MTEPHKRPHRHPKYKTAYRVKNWREYEQALRNRGDFTPWSRTGTVDRRIAPPTAAPERRVKVSLHAAPQYGDACYAYLPGDVPCAPGSSHHGNVHVRLGDCRNGSSCDLHSCDPPPLGHHVGSTVRNTRVTDHRVCCQCSADSESRRQRGGRKQGAHDLVSSYLVCISRTQRLPYQQRSVASKTSLTRHTS